MPSSSLDDKKTMLTKFEVLLLNSSQVAEFNSLFADKSWVQDEPLFSSWLTLKLATIPTEKEALDQVLRSHKAVNVPKNKQKRKQNVPSGPTRFDPSSQDWISILEETEEVTAAKKRKLDAKKKSPKVTPAAAKKSKKKTVSIRS